MFCVCVVYVLRAGGVCEWDFAVRDYGVESIICVLWRVVCAALVSRKQLYADFVCSVVFSSWYKCDVFVWDVVDL